MNTSQKAITLKEAERARTINILILLVLATDLLTPFLIWKGILPAYVRWISHASIAAMMIIVYTRMMVFGRVPGAVWLVAGISAIGITVAVVEGQDLLPTAWGWWIMFQYPLVGLFAYLQPIWPNNFPKKLLHFCVLILALQVLLQIGQYLTGQSPGDNLAGLFGYHGTGKMVIFILFVLCLALGEWLVTRDWRTLFLVLVLASSSSVLGEVKFFLFAALVLGVLAFILFIFRTKRFFKIIPIGLIFCVILLAFITTYNITIPSAENTPIETFIQNPNVLLDYLNRADRRYDGENIYYNIGRNFAINYGWNSIRQDTQTFIFGLGIGARGESRTLGTVGSGLLRGSLGITTGTSLLVFMHELGVLGLVILFFLYVWLLFSLLKLIRTSPRSDSQALRYALLLFSALWPLWLWYNMAWTLRVPMLLYWVALGYVLREAYQNKVVKFDTNIKSRINMELV